ncbi:TetR/AcrR family transcriptional regulator [Hoyosella sp. G463]|uniref:TetR/AcrR family transcriptional regulator n=1 Tax=Lolliginicoccus lacisalsi TaxID=2742202 RepID=A0A927PN25_9ACTN|nr:TetR/AcrR family transcriptional regulator [Lolliginicoccus lacisalsi]MBD8507472.1 TetR/AcrR family transcriptional regulator [Lolliginicoccus lacisalsi]
MGGQSKRLPRAIREQQMLDAAIDVFAKHGYHGASMNAIAAEAEISKPMLYLYYGSKDELFAACIRRESTRFLDALTGAADPTLTPREQLEHGIRVFLGFVNTNRKAWRVLYRQALYQNEFAELVLSSRDRAVELTALILRSSSRDERSNDQYRLMATVLIGAGEAVADLIADGTAQTEDAVTLLTDLAWRGLAGRKPVH